MRNLEYATIRESDVEPRTRHFVGLPPELTGNEDARRALPVARVVVLQEGDGGSIFLTRFTAQGEEVGDTWHASIADAKGQAEFEYGDALGEWKAVPDDIRDIAAFMHHRA